MLLFEKFGQHQPLNRQAERFAREGLDLSLSTLADQVGAAAAALAPLHEALEAHILAAGRLWVYLRDDRPFGGADPPAAVFRYSRDRKGEHPRAHLETWSGILQADAYGGYAELYAPDRKPGLTREAACFAHARRKFFERADLEGAARKRARGQNPTPVSPLALEVLRRIDALFDIERDLNGKSPEERRAGRQERNKPLMQDLQLWMTNKREVLSRHHPLARAFAYMLTRWEAFTAFLDDGRICLSNNAAERSLRPVALGRKAWLFAGSDRGGERAALLYGRIETAKLNGVDPQPWLAWVLGKIADHPATRINELLPWNFQKNQV